MSAIWYRVVTAIDICNIVIQSGYARLDVEIANIGTLLEDLLKLRSKCKKYGRKLKILRQILILMLKSSMAEKSWVGRVWVKMQDDTSTPATNLAK